MRRLAMFALLLWIGFNLGPLTVIRGGEELWGLSGTVWVTNRSLNNVARYDAATGLLRGSVAVEQAPIGIVVPPGTGKVYVSNESSNTVSVLSASSMALLKTIATGPRPHHMMHDSSGFVYVAEFGSNQVGLIDTPNGHANRRTAREQFAHRPDACILARPGRHVIRRQRGFE